MPPTRTKPSAPRRGDTEPPLTSEDLRDRIRAIKLTTLKLCQLVGDTAPPGRRRETAIQAIRTGVRLSLELLEDQTVIKEPM